MWARGLSSRQHVSSLWGCGVSLSVSREAGGLLVCAWGGNLPWPPSQLIIGGLDKIDLDDWKSNTRLKHCGADSNVVRWFWQAVETFDEERRARLLQFVTGSTRVPLQGFKALQGD